MANPGDIFLLGPDICSMQVILPVQLVGIPMVTNELKKSTQVENEFRSDYWPGFVST